MIPIHDDNPVSRAPVVNLLLIVTNVLAFLYTLSVSDPQALLVKGGTIPDQVVHNFQAEWPTLFTAMFLHAGLIHLGGNMVYLYIFGDNVEDIMGRFGYAIFYLLCGLVGGATHILSDPNSMIPAVGASGAISGVLGAYVRYFPTARVRTIAFLSVIRVPAYVLIGFWFFYQLFLAFILVGEGGVAYWAHIGGFIFGLVVALLIPRRAQLKPSGTGY